MKRLFFLIFLFIVPSKISFSQEVKKPIDNKYLFNPYADAQKALNDALMAAQKTHRHILVAVGGDWSFWSRKMYGHLIRNHQYYNNYELVFINFSPVNKNETILNQLHVPKDRGYPILIVLDENGNPLLTTDTDDLKLNPRAYDDDLLATFTEKWLTYKSNDKK